MLILIVAVHKLCWNCCVNLAAPRVALADGVSEGLLGRVQIYWCEVQWDLRAVQQSVPRLLPCSPGCLHPPAWGTWGVSEVTVVTSTGVDVHERGMQALVPHWQKDTAQLMVVTVMENIGL